MLCCISQWHYSLPIGNIISPSISFLSHITAMISLFVLFILNKYYILPRTTVYTTEVVLIL